MYTGKDTFADVKCENDNIGLSTKAVLALSSSLSAGTVIYCDRYFTSFPLLYELSKKQLHCTGTIQKNRINEAAKKCSVDKDFMKKTRGTSELVISGDKKMRMAGQ